MTADLPTDLVDYLHARDAQRTRDVENVLAHLTERERRLVREAATLGYTAGTAHPVGAEHPKDSIVVHNVIGDRLTTGNERERRLVRETVVMGYVEGRWRLGAPTPDGDAVLRLVVDSCLAHRDLYPVLTGVQPCGECGHPKYNHRDGDDPVTPGLCRECDLDAASQDDAHHDFRLPATEETRP